MVPMHYCTYSCAVFCVGSSQLMRMITTSVGGEVGLVGVMVGWGGGEGGRDQMCRRINGVRKVSKEGYAGTGIKASPVSLFFPLMSPTQVRNRLEKLSQQKKKEEKKENGCLGGWVRVAIVCVLLLFLLVMMVVMMVVVVWGGGVTRPCTKLKGTGQKIEAKGRREREREKGGGGAKVTWNAFFKTRTLISAKLVAIETNKHLNS